MPDDSASSTLLEVARMALPILVLTRMRCMVTAMATAARISHSHMALIRTGPTSKDGQMMLKNRGAQPQISPMLCLIIKPSANAAIIRCIRVAPRLASGWKIPL